MDNFEGIKLQLAELAQLVNSFNSEAVQLRILEFLLGAQRPFPIAQTAKERTKGARRTKPRSSVAEPKDKSEMRSGTQRRSRVGPGAILDELVEDGFFNTHQTISKIREHAQSNKARALKANEWSPALIQFVRLGKLKRKKNSDGQFEYYKA